MNFILQILISTLAVIVTSYLLPGVKVDSPYTALVVAAVLSFLNVVVKPIMILLTIPITILSLGLFLIIINALMILLTDRIVDGFEVHSFWYAILFSIILSLTTSVFENLSGDKKI